MYQSILYYYYKGRDDHTLHTDTSLRYISASYNMSTLCTVYIKSGCRKIGADKIWSMVIPEYAAHTHVTLELP